jgi:hypothetical protein
MYSRRLRGDRCQTLETRTNDLPQHLPGRDPTTVSGLLQCFGLPARQQECQLDNLVVDGSDFSRAGSRGEEAGSHRTDRGHVGVASEASFWPPRPGLVGRKSCVLSWRRQGRSIVLHLVPELTLKPLRNPIGMFRPITQG